MTIRVRFAPSPTGYLHIGGARTALYNYLFAKARGGKFILRIEDTDRERSKKEYEEKQIEDLKWLGITHDEGPDCPGEYGPYRQSERLEIYKKHAHDLIEKGHAFHCFCSEDDIEKMREKATKEGRPPHYDGRCRNLSEEEVASKLAGGEKAVMRLKAPLKPFVLQDHVRGRVVFPENMVGDFVIMRSNGFPVYNFCCVVDDWLMKMTHVIRGEDHLSNTVRQLMIYEVLEATPPEFAHVSLLVGKDRQKLSKRHGSTSVINYKQETYLPDAMVNYLSLLGWSHPEEKDIFDTDEAAKVFTIDRFSKSPAVFDLEKFRYVNGQHIKAMPIEKLYAAINEFIPSESLYHKQDETWQKNCLNLYKDQINFFAEINSHIDTIFNGSVDKSDTIKDVLSWDSTPTILSYLKSEIKTRLANGKLFVDESTFNEWSTHIKKELKIKGKPLFMGMRVSLTAVAHGPELKFLIPLTPLSVISERLEQLES